MPTATAKLNAPTRWNSFALYLMTLALMIGLYSLYARFAVPMIEGPPNIVRLDFRPPNVELSPRQFDKEQLSALFKVDAWEHDNCKVLSTEQGLIMFQEFHRVEGGHLEVLPFTMVMRDAKQATGKDSDEQPMVLRCSKGARLKFDDPNVDPLAGKSQLESAWLVGTVDIYRPSSGNSKDDSIEILTSNVQITKRQVFTIDDVQFAFGSHRGQGRQLSIEFSHAATVVKQPGFESINGVKRIELAYLKQLQLIHNSKTSKGRPNRESPGRPSSPTSVADESTVAPVTITCSGPFVLDMERKTATFNEQVHVALEGKNESEINCKRLTVHFDSNSKRTSQSVAPPSPAESTNLSGEQWALQRLIAEGSPASFISQVHSAQVTGNILSYDVTQEEIVAQQLVNSSTPVVVLTPDFRFQAIQIAYKLRSDRKLGQLLAQGPGNLLRAATEKERGFYVEWKRLLSVEPDGEQHLITLADGCQIRLDENTQIKAQLMKLWLNEAARATVNVPGQVKPKTNYQPDHLLATGKVEVISPQLDGKTEKLKANWFVSDSPLEKQAKILSRHQPQISFPEGGNADPNQLGVRAIFPTSYRIGSDHPIANGGDPSQLQESEIPAGMQRIEFASRVPAVRTQHPAAQEDAGTKTANQWLPYDESNEPNRGTWVQPVDFQDEPKTQIKRYSFSGNEVEVKLLYHDDVTVIQDLTATGEVEISELADARATDDRPPLTITGHSLRCVPQAEKCVRVLVSGEGKKWAVVNTEQFELAGDQIHLDQSANKLWIDGPGESNLKLLKSAGGRENTVPGFHDTGQVEGAATQRLDFKNSNYQSIKVEWRSGMVFNGRKIYFEDGVYFSAHGTNPENGTVLTSAAGKGVTVELSQQFDFRNLKSEQQTQMEVREIIIVDQVAGGQRVFNLAKANITPKQADSPSRATITHQTSTSSGELMEKQQFDAHQITMDVRTGLVTSKGPGTLMHHRRGSTQMMGSNAMNSARNRNRISGTPTTRGGVTFVRVNFDGTANASTNEKRLLIRGNVRTLYANVDSFDRVLDPDQAKGLPADSVKVKCDRLEFSQWTPRNSEESVQELLAVGNAHVTSESFEAVANQIRYSQGNDTLVVEGTPRSDAQLWYHPVADPNDRKHLIAEKVIYRPGDQSYEIQAIKNIDSKN